MKYNIESETDLEKALNEARNGDTIDGQGLPLTIKNEYYVINRNLKLINLNFTYIQNIDKTQDNNISLFTVREGAGIEMDRCLVTGDSNYLDCFVKTHNARYLIADNCKLYFSRYSAIWLAKCNYSLITNSKFLLESPFSYGYGIWQGGRGDAKNNQLTVKDCSFYDCRHAIAGSYHTNHIHIEDNDFYDTTQQVLDRHAGDYNNNNAQGVGGGNYTVIGNTFHGTGHRSVDVQIPLDNYEVRVENNVFSRKFGENMKFESIAGISNESNVNHPQIIIGTNYYTQ